MKDVVDRLRTDFGDPEYRHVYDEGFLNSSIATQLKVLREERGWTQEVMAEKAGINQSRVSELEDINFNSWTIRTLRKFAKGFDLRLKISFEEFGTLLEDFRNLNRKGLSRRSFALDPEFHPATKPAARDYSIRVARMPTMERTKQAPTDPIEDTKPARTAAIIALPSRDTKPGALSAPPDKAQEDLSQAQLAGAR